MKISVVTPFYEGDRYMQDYVDCMEKNREMLAQAGHELEVILVNDSPWKTLMAPANGGQYFRVLTNSENRGIHYSRVSGLAEATGEYVMFLDQDDLLAEDGLLRLMEVALKNPSDIIIGNANLGQADGSNLVWYRTADHVKLIWDLQTYLNVGIQIISPGHTCIYKKAIPKEWTEYICTYNGADDYFLWLLMLSKGVEFKYIDKVLYLDADIICSSNLSELYNTDISNSYVAVVPDIPKFTENFKNSNPSWEHSYYFNSGVMLINLFLWHQDNVSEKLVNFMINSETLEFPDQDALNLVLPEDRIIYLPKKFNATVIVDPKTGQLPPCQLALIHFANKKKPWKPDADLKNSWNRLYQTYIEYLEPNRKYWWSSWSSDKHLWSPQSRKDYKMMGIFMIKKLRLFSALYSFTKYLQLKITNSIKIQ